MLFLNPAGKISYEFKKTDVTCLEKPVNICSVFLFRIFVFTSFSVLSFLRFHRLLFLTSAIAAFYLIGILQFFVVSEFYDYIFLCNNQSEFRKKPLVVTRRLSPTSIEDNIRTDSLLFFLLRSHNHEYIKTKNITSRY